MIKQAIYHWNLPLTKSSDQTAMFHTPKSKITKKSKKTKTYLSSPYAIFKPHFLKTLTKHHAIFYPSDWQLLKNSSRRVKLWKTFYLYTAHLWKKRLSFRFDAYLRLFQRLLFADRSLREDEWNAQSQHFI